MRPRLAHRVFRRASQKCDARGAFSLLEMLAVLALLGIIAIAAAGAFRPQTIGDMDGQVAAQRIAWDLQQARRRAIADGRNHLLSFTNSGATLTGYTLNRRNADTSLTAVDAAKTFATYVTVTGSSTAPEFTFEGAALAGYTYTVTTPHRVWTVTVAAATGTVTVN